MEKQKVSWNVLFENFILASQVEGKSIKTLEWYKYLLTQFINSVPLDELSIYQEDN